MKSEYHKDGEGIHAVALFARAWIEIFGSKIFYAFITVALFARAWIEIVYKRRVKLH